MMIHHLSSYVASAIYQSIFFWYIQPLIGHPSDMVSSTLRSVNCLQENETIKTLTLIYKAPSLL